MLDKSIPRDLRSMMLKIYIDVNNLESGETKDAFHASSNCGGFIPEGALNSGEHATMTPTSPLSALVPGIRFFIHILEVEIGD